MQGKFETSNPITIILLSLLAIVVMAVVVMTNSIPFISSGIKLGQNTDSATMLVYGHAGDEITIHYDVEAYNGSLEIYFGQGAFRLTAKQLWTLELESGKTKDSTTIEILDDGLYLVHVQEYSFGGTYNINWKVSNTK